MSWISSFNVKASIPNRHYDIKETRLMYDDTVLYFEFNESSLLGVYQGMQLKDDSTAEIFLKKKNGETVSLQGDADKVSHEEYTLSLKPVKKFKFVGSLSKIREKRENAKLKAEMDGFSLVA